MANSGNSRKLTKAQLAQVGEAIAGGEFQEELHQQVAPLLKEQAGAIVRRGVAQNTTAVVVSPWTLAKWVGRKAVGGYVRVHTRVAAARAARAERRAETAEAAPEAAPATA
jgi:hypothetical protein